MQFPLKAIREILDSPDFNVEEALEQQIILLELQQTHIAELISFARKLKEHRGHYMKFDSFDKSKLEQYKKEARPNGGKTDAYKEYEQKEKADGNIADAGKRMMELFAGIGVLKQLEPTDAKVQEKIEALRSFISEHYYTCTPETSCVRGLSTRPKGLPYP